MSFWLSGPRVRRAKTVPQGLKPSDFFAAFTARINPCPFKAAELRWHSFNAPTLWPGRGGCIES